MGQKNLLYYSYLMIIFIIRTAPALIITTRSKSCLDCVIYFQESYMIINKFVPHGLSSYSVAQGIEGMSVKEYTVSSIQYIYTVLIRHMTRSNSNPIEDVQHTQYSVRKDHWDRIGGL